MVKLILLGEGRSETLERFLTETLSRHFSLTVCTGPRAFSAGTGTPLLLLSPPELFAADLRGALFLARNGARLPQELHLPDDAVVIVSSEEENQLLRLARLQVQTVTCGLSCKDTVTFSSRSEETAVISLMRSVCGLSGEAVEPMDLPVSFPPRSGDYPLLACAAVLLLTGALSGKPPEKYFQL